MAQEISAEIVLLTFILANALEKVTTFFGLHMVNVHELNPLVRMTAPNYWHTGILLFMLFIITSLIGVWLYWKGRTGLLYLGMLVLWGLAFYNSLILLLYFS